MPPNNSTAKGWAWFIPTKEYISYQVNANGLVDLTKAHICSGKIGINGNVAAVLFESNNDTGVTNGMFAHSKITARDLKGPMGGKSIPDLVQSMKNGEMYTNIQTRTFPDGEIRGQIAIGFDNWGF